MPHSRHWLLHPGTSLVCMALLVGLTVGARLASADACEGKPYGWKGCPLKSQMYPIPVSCGDGVVSGGEQCDDGPLNGQTDCAQNCQYNVCGDGELSPLTEECEPPAEEYYAVDSKGRVILERKFSPLPSCSYYCALPTCTSPDNCTGGCNRVLRKGCSEPEVTATSIRIPRASGITADITPATSSTPKQSSVSSIAKVSSSSSLSASASSSARSLSSSSLSSSQSLSSSSSSAKSAFAFSSKASALCGNGILEPGEQCDDGNVIEDDACTTLCRRPMCGDGIRQPGEECDDGNQDQKDSCTNYCLLPICGNGVVEGKEECDDPFPGRCEACRLALCGNGFLDQGEECDEGTRNANADPAPCSTRCTKRVCGGAGCALTVSHQGPGSGRSLSTSSRPRVTVVSDPGEIGEGPNIFLLLGIVILVLGSGGGFLWYMHKKRASEPNMLDEPIIPEQ